MSDFPSVVFSVGSDWIDIQRHFLTVKNTIKLAEDEAIITDGLLSHALWQVNFCSE